MIGSMGLTFDKLYKLYVGKVVLNKFRQENGYKKGTYQKIWDGKEDNEVLYEILEGLDCDDSNFESDIKSRLYIKYGEAQ